MMKPLDLSPTKEEVAFFFIKSYSFEIVFEEQSFTLEQYLEHNKNVNSFIPEITLVNLMAQVTHALHALHRYGIKHGNVSTRTIFLSSKNNWLVTAPNFQKVNLRK